MFILTQFIKLKYKKLLKCVQKYINQLKTKFQKFNLFKKFFVFEYLIILKVS